MRRRLLYSAPALLAAVLMAGCAGTGTLAPGTSDPQTPSEHAAGPAKGGGSASMPSAGPGDRPSDKPSDHASRQSKPTHKSSDKPSHTPSHTPSTSPTESSESDQQGSDSDSTAKSDSKAKSDSSDSKNADRVADTQLRYGDSGPKVAALQKRLKSLGYWVSGTDGAFGPTTQQAVFAIQKVAGLSRDGVVGEKTRRAIDAGRTPSPQSSSGRVVEVDLKRQIVMIVVDGDVQTIFNTSTASGKYYTSEGERRLAVTPRGHFTVSRQIDGPRQSKLGYLWRPKYFNGGIALHGEHNDVPAYPVSHGCVRVTDAAMNWIWSSDQVPIGTKVWVY